MSEELFLKFVPRVRVERTADSILLHHPHYAEAIPVPQKFDWLITALLETTHSEEMLMDKHQGDFAAMMATMNVYRQLSVIGMIGYVLRDEDKTFLELFPQTEGIEPILPDELDLDQVYRVSKFAYLHVEDNYMLIESAQGKAYLVVHEPQVLIWFAAFKTGISIIDFLVKFEHPRMLARAICCFISIGAIIAENEPQWDFHDAVFHTRSRRGRYRIFGSKQPLGDIETIPPAIKPTDSANAIALYKPDIDQLKQADMTLTAALETRTSVRQHGANPMTLRQLGEFLYRTARVTGYRQGENLTLTRRLYPAGGAVYELEIYLAVQACEGIEAGLYHYNPDAHSLTLTATFTPEVAHLVRQASSAALVENGQILVLMTARFQRMARFYHTLAYSLILKHVGALMQTMYLVATAMHLAPCAIGSGDSDLFADITSIPYFEEGLVGEMLVGSRELPPPQPSPKH
jgi:SagB-type dehydrogenase family enzyme